MSSTKTIATKAIKEHDASGKISRALVGLISSGLLARVEESGLQKKVKKEPFENIPVFASFAFGRFKTLIGDNNGITTVDQNKLFLPIGVDPSTEDPVSMAALDSFGKKRGRIAHQFKIAKEHTLSEIETDLASITASLPVLDQSCLDSLN